MPRIPFMHATFRDDLPTPEAVETRLKDTLEALPTGAGADPEPRTIDGRAIPA